MLGGGKVSTYHGLSGTADDVAAWLEARGVQAGDRVAFACPAGPDWPAWIFGVLRRGAIFCPLNTRLPEPTLQRRAARLDAALMLEDPPAVGGSRREAVGSMQTRGRPATIVFTSGSGGDPQAVVHSLSNHLTAAEGALRHSPMGAGDRWLMSLPMFHVGGLAIPFRSVLAGSALVFPESGEEMVDSLRARDITHVSMVPTQLCRLLESGRARAEFPRLKRILLGGAPIPRDLVRRARADGWPVAASYGMTETASQVAAVSPEAEEWEAAHSDGRPLPHAKIRISESGEILVRGGSVTPGVWERGRIRSIVDGEGWLHTGDNGRLERGCLVVEGRRDLQFISGGENIHPEEIERALLDLAGCSRAVVVPVPDAEFGHRPAAWLDLPVDGGRVRAWTSALREKLPGYMLPVRFDTLPESVGLKPDRRELARRMAEAYSPGS